MTNEVDVSTVLDALSAKIGALSVENEVLKLQAGQASEVNAELVKKLQALRLTLRLVGLDEDGQPLVDGVNP